MFNFYTKKVLEKPTYKVTVSFNEERRDLMYAWCRERFTIGSWNDFSRGIGDILEEEIRFEFVREEDAMIFALAWK